MLVEFRVSNYRSIRDEQVLSLVPVRGDTTLHAGNTHPTSSKQIPEVLCGAGIYGANASGKTNLLKALAFFQAMVRDSATKLSSGQTLNVKGFAFDEELIHQPSSFEIGALIDGIRYQYGFSASTERVHDEWLLVYKAAKPQQWFSREWDRDKTTYHYTPFSSHFLGSKDNWRLSTRENALFLSTAVQWNSEQLKPLWNWIVNSLVVIEPLAPLNPGITLAAIDDADSKKAILGFLNSADLGIADVEVRKEPGRQTNFIIDGATGRIVANDVADAEMRIPVFKHTTAKGNADFGPTEESSGTMRLFAFAGILLLVLRRGMTLVIDEIESSMHPLLVRHILSTFFSSDANPQGAQIVFSTHATGLLDDELLRRDQVYFTEKDPDQATTLTPLSEFSARRHEAFERNYLQGRYGAVPILSAYHGEGTTNARA
jgi:AAA15 family ATPase/GTPase